MLLANNFDCVRHKSLEHYFLLISISFGMFVGVQLLVHEVQVTTEVLFQKLDGRSRKTCQVGLFG